MTVPSVVTNDLTTTTVSLPLLSTTPTTTISTVPLSSHNYNNSNNLVNTNGYTGTVTRTPISATATSPSISELLSLPSPVSDHPEYASPAESTSSSSANETEDESHIKNKSHHFNGGETTDSEFETSKGFESGTDDPKPLKNYEYANPFNLSRIDENNDRTSPPLNRKSPNTSHHLISKMSISNVVSPSSPIPVPNSIPNLQDNTDHTPTSRSMTEIPQINLSTEVPGSKKRGTFPDDFGFLHLTQEEANAASITYPIIMR